MVTVQLVEKRVNKMLGMLIPAVRMTQSRMVDIRFKMVKMSHPKKPSQPCESWAATASVAVLMAAARVVVDDCAALSATTPAMWAAFDKSDAMAGGAAARARSTALCRAACWRAEEVVEDSRC